MAFQTGTFLKQQLQSLKDESKRSKNAKFCIITSPYYRCLQTSLQIAKAIGFEDIHQKSFFIENAVEEWWNSREIPEDAREKRFWGNRFSEEMQKEIFYEIIPKDQTLFDYKKNIKLNPVFDEDMNEQCHERFSLTYKLICQMSEDDPDKVFLVVSHGASVESMKKVLENYTFPEYCGINLLEKKSDDEGQFKGWGHPISNHYGYK